MNSRTSYRSRRFATAHYSRTCKFRSLLEYAYIGRELKRTRSTLLLEFFWRPTIMARTLRLAGTSTAHVCRLRVDKAATPEENTRILSIAQISISNKSLIVFNERLNHKQVPIQARIILTDAILWVLITLFFRVKSRRLVYFCFLPKRYR